MSSTWSIECELSPETKPLDHCIKASAVDHNVLENQHCVCVCLFEINNMYPSTKRALFSSYRLCSAIS